MSEPDLAGVLLKMEAAMDNLGLRLYRDLRAGLCRAYGIGSREYYTVMGRGELNTTLDALAGPHGKTLWRVLQIRGNK